MTVCEECYSNESRVTPLLKPEQCLREHTQYVCSSCGRCICIEKDPKRGLRRWNFPFKSVEIAKLYLRAAEVSVHGKCGVYEIKSKNERVQYKIFEGNNELESYLKKHTEKLCEQMAPVYETQSYKDFSEDQIRKLTIQEIEIYLREKKFKENYEIKL